LPSKVSTEGVVLLTSELFRGDPRLEAAARDDAAHIFKGCIGAYVTKIQMALNQLTNANLNTDGIYGPKTAAAVFNFKKNKNIINPKYQSSPDDIVGKMTIAELDRELGNHSLPTVTFGTPYPRRVDAFSITSPPTAQNNKSTSFNYQSIVRGSPFVRANARDVGLPPSVPPGRAYEFLVTVTPPITNNDVIELDIINGGSGRGSAIVRPEKIKSSTRAFVLGGDQTSLGNAAALQVQAKINGKVITTSAAFTVCAHPISVSSDFDQLCNKEYFVRNSAALRPLFGNQYYVGIITASRVESDSGSDAHLDQVRWGEIVEMTSTDMPPFTSRGATAQTNSIDVQKYPFFSRDAHAARPRQGPEGKQIASQLHYFHCDRCGGRDVPIPYSGFEITHHVKQQNGVWVLVVNKRVKEAHIFVDRDRSPDQRNHGYSAMPGKGGVVDEHPVGIPNDYSY
jgi:peptidoglycan hydrolase-like protein with peptidoglycan-binding domain